MTGRHAAEPPRVVALGGGHGLSATLTALRHVTSAVTAVVTVADNGGSSGRLRRDLEILPPGDLRKALSALCGDDEWGRTWSRVLQHRFTGAGELNGHTVGNLLLVGLWDLLQDQVGGLDLVGRLLGTTGRVLPMATVPLDITARVEESDGSLRDLRGQVEVATAVGRIRSVALDPPDPPACDEAVTAVREAEWVVLGPGSWFTSVLPHLLVPALRSALVDRSDRLVVVLNLSEQPGETGGFSAHDHLAVLREVAPDLRVHTVIADRHATRDTGSLEQEVSALGARSVVAPVAGGPHAHDPEALACVLAGVMGLGGPGADEIGD